MDTAKKQDSGIQVAVWYEIFSSSIMIETHLLKNYFRLAGDSY